MTYCLAATVTDGLVFVSDSRTNAGIDQLGTFSKMHPFTDIPGRFFTLLSAGNLATTQAVVARLHRDLRENAARSLATVKRIRVPLRESDTLAVRALECFTTLRTNSRPAR